MELSFEEMCYRKFENTINERKLFDNIDRFLILYSFGKDCTMMMDLFFRYYEEHSLRIPYSVFTVPYPKHMYYSNPGVFSDEVLETLAYWENRGIKIEIEEPQCDDLDFDDKYGCKVCKRSRKPVLDKYINACGGNTGILTGFTIYDALAYLTMIQLTCDYDLSRLSSLEEPLRSNTSKMLHKMSLRENLPNGKVFIRPMLPFNEQDIQEYMRAVKLPCASTSCQITKYKFKRILSRGLDLYDDFPVTYEGIERFLERNGIILNDGGLSFDDVREENYYVDC